MYLAERGTPVGKDPAGVGGTGESGPATRGGATGRVAGPVLALGVVSLFTDLSSEAVAAVLPLYLTAALGLSPLAFGLVDGINQGVSALVRIGAGVLADRADRPKWVATLGYGLSALARVALLFSQAIGALVAVVTVDRLGKGIRTAPRDAMIAAAAPSDALGRNFGTHRALDTVGALLGPLAAFLVLWALPGDYRSVFVVSLAAAVVGVAVLLVAVPDIRPRRMAARPAGHERCAIRCRECAFAESFADARRDEPSPRPSRAVLRDPRLRSVTVVAGLLGVLTVGDGFLYLVLQRSSDLAAAYFPLLYVGTNAAFLALAVPFGRLADRWGRVRVYLVGHLLLAAAFACAIGVSGVAGVVLVLGLLGLHYAATDGVIAALIARLVPAQRRASGLALVQTVIALARFASSLGFGALWVWLGPRPALTIVLGLLLVATAASWMLLRGLDEVPAPDQTTGSTQ